MDEHQNGQPAPPEDSGRMSMRITSLSPADFEDLQLFVQRNRKYAADFKFPEFDTVEKLTAILESARRAGELEFAVRFGEQFAGLITLRPRAQNTMEVLVIIDEQMSNQGLATAAVSSVAEFYFSEHPDSKMMARFANVNQPAIRVLEKIGFIPLAGSDVDTAYVLTKPMLEAALRGAGNA